MLASNSTEPELPQHYNWVPIERGIKVAIVTSKPAGITILSSIDDRYNPLSSSCALGT